MINQLRSTHSDDGRPHTLALTNIAHILHVKLKVSMPLNTKNEVMESSQDNLSKVTITLLNFQPLKRNQNPEGREKILVLQLHSPKI